MEDLSNILIPKIPVNDGDGAIMPVLPPEVMKGFSDAEKIASATKLMGFEEATDGNE
jgi:hypothetical protein